MRSEGSQTRKTAYCMIPHIWKSRIYKRIFYKLYSRIYKLIYIAKKQYRKQLGGSRQEGWKRAQGKFWGDRCGCCLVMIAPWVSTCFLWEVKLLICYILNMFSLLCINDTLVKKILKRQRFALRDLTIWQLFTEFLSGARGWTDTWTWTTGVAPACFHCATLLKAQRCWQAVKETF